MTKGELMEISNESLALLAAQVRAEHERRHLGSDVVALNAGNVADDGRRPTPTLVRAITMIAKLPPSDVAKVAALIDGLAALRAAPREAPGA